MAAAEEAAESSNDEATITALQNGLKADRTSAGRHRLIRRGARESDRPFRTRNYRLLGVRAGFPLASFRHGDGRQLVDRIRCTSAFRVLMEAGC